MKMTETMIKKLEAKGFKRWTKGEHDRLYANVENFGLELHHYNSGNISGATLNGEKISNSYGAEIKRNTSIYLNVNDGELYLTDRANGEIVANVKAAIAEAEEEAAAEEAAQEPAETENAVAEVEAATNLTGTPEQIAAAQKIIEDQKIFVEKKIRKFQEKLTKNAGNEKRVASYTKKSALCAAHSAGPSRTSRALSGGLEAQNAQTMVRRFATLVLVDGAPFLPNTWKTPA